jgi:hypothetical protein
MKTAIWAQKCSAYEEKRIKKRRWKNYTKKANLHSATGCCNINEDNIKIEKECEVMQFIYLCKDRD